MHGRLVRIAEPTGWQDPRSTRDTVHKRIGVGRAMREVRCGRGGGGGGSRGTPLVCADVSDSRESRASGRQGAPTGSQGYWFPRDLRVTP